MRRFELFPAERIRARSAVFSRSKMKEIDMDMRQLFAVALTFAWIAAGTGESCAQLQPPPGGVKRTVLQKTDVPGTNFEVIQAIAEIPAKTATGRHTHPGPETSTVLEGEMTLKVDGQPDKPLKAGDSFQVPSGVIHDAVTGDKPVKLIIGYTVEKGKPLATPALAK
jgi:quercetin dioxygenase-like cupin family protein